jgi:hypothetical protein
MVKLKSESNMSKAIAFSTIAAAALAGAMLLSAAEPVAAGSTNTAEKTIRRPCDSAASPVEQCVAMISGRGGSCVRNPLLSEASASYAHAPKRHGRTRRHHGAL